MADLRYFARFSDGFETPLVESYVHALRDAVALEQSPFTIIELVESNVRIYNTWQAAKTELSMLLPSEPPGEAA